MSFTNKSRLLIWLTIIALIGVYFLPAIPQPPSFHHFADTRTIWGIPNFANVISNIPFVFVGVYGLLALYQAKATRGIRAIYFALFLGIILTGLGSAYYHYSPDNETLVFDRIPMTLVFMALLSATIAELINCKFGTRLLGPLLLIGMGSVLWWHFGEQTGHGDLRLFGLVQFYPMVFIPLILWLFYDPGQKRAIISLCWVVVWYGIAKVLESRDKDIFALTGFVSGHTLKHLAAGVSTLYLVKMFRIKYMKNLRHAF